MRQSILKRGFYILLLSLLRAIIEPWIEPLLLATTTKLLEHEELTPFYFFTKLFSSICVGYLTHRLVHFRIRVNGPEDNGVYQKHKALVTLEPWLSGSTYSIIVTTSCICSWVRAVVNWFTTLFFARKSIISSSKRRQKSNRVLRFLWLDGVYVKSQRFFRFCYDFCFTK